MELTFSFKYKFNTGKEIEHITHQIMVVYWFFHFLQDPESFDNTIQWQLIHIFKFHMLGLLEEWGVLVLVKLQALASNFTKTNTPPWMFFTFFKLWK